MLVSVLQLDYTIGDFSKNSQKILAAYNQAIAEGAQLVCAAAAAVSGYPAFDLANRTSFLQEESDTLSQLAAQIQAVPLLLTDNSSFAVLQAGKLRRDLPALTEIGAIKLGLIGANAYSSLEIHQQFSQLVKQGANLIIHAAAHQFDMYKLGRFAVFYQELSAMSGIPTIYVNHVGAQDGLVFAGESKIIDNQGQIVAQAASFRDDIISAEITLPTAAKISDMPLPAYDSTKVCLDHIAGWEKAVADALCLALKDYMAKCGFKSVLIGLSGGIDSALVATLAVRALGADAVHGITMPSRYSPENSPNDAHNLAKALGIAIDTIPIEPIFAQGLKSLEPVLGEQPWGLAQENMQARIRGVLLMTYSNKNGNLVLATGNKSETAVGYCTLYGDTCGGLELISDLYKTDVYKLAAFLNKEAGKELIPNSTLTKPPSAELAPGQKDQDSLPPYEVLDDILRRYVDGGQAIDNIVTSGHDRATVDRVLYLLRRAEYKRAQTAPVVKISGLSFGSDRHYPIAHAFKG